MGEGRREGTERKERGLILRGMERREGKGREATGEVSRINTKRRRRESVCEAADRATAECIYLVLAREP